MSQLSNNSSLSGGGYRPIRAPVELREMSTQTSPAKQTLLLEAPHPPQASWAEAAASSPPPPHPLVQAKLPSATLVRGSFKLSFFSTLLSLA